MDINPQFWKGRPVFITGHTGFKGGWLALWLTEMGAKVYGYSLEVPTSPSFFNAVNLKNKIQNSAKGDIRNLSSLRNSIQEAKPSVIFHMAAQPLVRKSYQDPVETFMTNLIGTINVYESVRKTNAVEAIVNITTDKCYENQEQDRPYHEDDRLGGYDPYSSSKACSEIASSAYRNSFLSEIGVKLASVRAGNVIGGGDWASDRLIPDFFRSIENKEILCVRSPNAIRPWQHVLDPLLGYIILAEKLVTKGDNFAEPWNFGPDQSGAKTVSWVLDRFSKKFSSAEWQVENTKQPHESNILKLDISKAKTKLGWKPRWTIETAIDNTIIWYQAFKENANMYEFSTNQIKHYQNS